MAPADVNADTTGVETNSTRKPKLVLVNNYYELTVSD